MYKFDPSQEVVSSQFPVQCDVDQVTLDKCEYIAQNSWEANSWEAIDFLYKRRGSVLKDRMFSINPNGATARSWVEGDTVEDALEARTAVFMTQLKHIATKFGITDEQLYALGELKTFKDLATAYCKMVNDKRKGVKMYCKTIRNQDGFTKLARGKNSTMPFLQNMAEGDCTLHYTNFEIANNELYGKPQNGAVKTDNSFTPARV